MFSQNTNKGFKQRKKVVPKSVYKLCQPNRNSLSLHDLLVSQQMYNPVYRGMMPPCMSKHHSDATRNATTPFLYEVAYATSKQYNGGAEHTMMNGMYEDDGKSVTIQTPPPRGWRGGQKFCPFGTNFSQLDFCNDYIRSA